TLSTIIRQNITDVVDHKNLNLDVPFMKGILPSAENVAIAFWNVLLPHVEKLGCKLHSVKLQETENNSVEYFGNNKKPGMKKQKTHSHVVMDDDKNSNNYVRIEKYNGTLVKSLSEEYGKLLSEIGENPKRQGLLKTPERAAKAIQFLTHGYDIDPASIMRGALFKEKYSQMVIVKDIELYSLCEHHMLP